MKDQDGFPDLVNFGLRLRAMRKRTNLNQTDFSALGGVGLGSQSRYEKGETQPAVGYLAALATRGFDIGYLLTGRHSADSLDDDTSALVSAFQGLQTEQRSALLVFLGAFTGSAASEQPDEQKVGSS